MDSEKYDHLVKAYLESSPGNEPKEWIEMLSKGISSLATGPYSKPAVEFQPVDIELDTGGLEIKTHNETIDNSELVNLFSNKEHVSICKKTYLTVVVLPPRYLSDETGTTNGVLCAQYHHIDRRIPGSAQRGIQAIVGANSGVVSYFRLRDYPDITFFFTSTRFEDGPTCVNPWIGEQITGNLALVHRKNDQITLGITPYSDADMWSK